MKFIKYTKVWFTISILVILAGVGAMINNKVKHGTILAYGIDFTGGSLMEISFQKEVEANQLDQFRSDLKQVFMETFTSGEADKTVSEPQVIATNEGHFVIQTKNVSEEEFQSINQAIENKLGAFELIRFNTIGPKIGETLKQKAVVAVVVALIAIVLFIAYAFRKVPKKVSPWKFGFAAIVALVHDIVITLGVFALLGYEVNAFFITALLTIMGFSVHDTIVVFDRIRENLKKQGRDDTFGDIADISLKQTMARSINTSVSTLLPLVALYVWGAPAIHTFVFALIVGIIVGTYSSIFIASPLLTLWQERGRIR